MLLTLPVLIYLGFGGYALWQTGLFRWTWWLIPGCWLLTYVIARIWPVKKFVRDLEPIPGHWTPQDEAALQIVTRFQKDVDQLSPEQLTDLQFYLQQSQNIAAAVAKHYHPRGKDPYSSLTVLEVLAAIRLAVEDIEIWFQKSVPGSHLVTIQQWKMLARAPEWVKRASEAGWLASIALNPVNVAKYFSSKLTLEPIAEGLRTEFLAAVYLRFVRQVGFYLIEMNSGRLRRGADRYRATFGAAPDLAGTERSETTATSLVPESVVVAIVGQVKAGKSSLVNALIGKREAVTDVLPATKSVSRYRVAVPDSSETMILLDTPGYGDAGASPGELKEMDAAVAQADVLLLVMDAHAPGRDADMRMLTQLRERAEKQPKLKPPPTVVCLTHVDLLSPMMEWDPPYDWRDPRSAKETSIHNAVQSIRELTGTHIADIVPVCTDEKKERQFNVQEGLIPALANVLNSGKMVALLKSYEQDLDEDRISALLGQLKSSGKALVNLWVQERLQQR